MPAPRRRHRLTLAALTLAAAFALPVGCAALRPPLMLTDEELRSDPELQPGDPAPPRPPVARPADFGRRSGGSARPTARPSGPATKYEEKAAENPSGGGR